MVMNVRDFSKWLLETFPEDAILVSTNSLSWHSENVEVLSYKDVANMFRLKIDPQIDGKPAGFPCLVVKDEKKCDY
jgi:hypothetical protein